MSNGNLPIFADCAENIDPSNRESGRNQNNAAKRTHADATVGSTSRLVNIFSPLIAGNQLQSTSNEPPSKRLRMQNVRMDNFQESERLRHRNRRNNLSDAQKTAIRNADQNRHFQRRISLTQEQTIAIRITNRMRNCENRSNLSSEQQAAVRTANRQRNSNKRANISAEELSAVRARDVERHRNRRIPEHVALKSYADHPDSKVLLYSCGPFTHKCSKCGAFHFEKETHDDTNAFSSCCQKGKVVLPELTFHDGIRNLMTNQHEHSQNFMTNIIQFNNSLSFASMGADIAPPPGHGPYCYRIHGQFYHQTGDVGNSSNGIKKYAKLYVLDSNQAVAHRLSHSANAECNPDLMRSLSTLITEVNIIARSYKMLSEVIQSVEQRSGDVSSVRMFIPSDPTKDIRRYNAPVSNEIAVVFDTADGAPPFDRDIKIHNRNGVDREHINIMHPKLDAYTYPLFFPNGDDGWHKELKHTGTNGGPGCTITQLQYYAYRLSVREKFNPLLHGGKLTQMFIVDSYCKVEASRIRFAAINQSKLRVESYKNLQQQIAARSAELGAPLGRQLISPSTFQGGPRNMQQNYHDAMAIVAKLGKPDLFLTMTCNPKWKEIVDNLEPNQKVEDRPDLVARVYNLKLNALLHELKVNHIFGKIVGHLYVVEYQKRGLPHAHILTILDEQDKLHTAELIDRAVSAEIPEPNIVNGVDLNENLRSKVLTHMIHGPCGKANTDSPCMKNNECSKKFPKPLIEATNPNVDGYPVHRRRK